VRKLRRIAQSELAGVDKLRYALNHERQRVASAVLTYRLRGGVSIALRRGTTDFKVFDEIFVERAYEPCVAALPDNLGRVTLIDLGANIGLSVLFLVRALNVVEIIAVEPDPDNFRLLSENLRTAALASRSIALRAFAGAELARAELHDSGNGAWGMRMGAFSDAGIPVLPLTGIADAAKAGLPILLKCDIEGGERQLFLHIRGWDHLIRFIFLELHTEFLSFHEMAACLESSSYQWTIHGTPASGDAVALLMLERGVVGQVSNLRTDF
jgi:FkbM family methyltransferase